MTGKSIEYFFVNKIFFVNGFNAHPAAKLLTGGHPLWLSREPLCLSLLRRELLVSGTARGSSPLFSVIMLS
jgi:hypothetical protein